MGVVRRTAWAAVIIANCGVSSHAQDADQQPEAATELPPVTVTAAPKAKSSNKKKPSTKSSGGQQPAPVQAAAVQAQPAPAFLGENPAPAPGTSSSDSGNAVTAAAADANNIRANAPNATVVMEGAQLQQYANLSIGDVVRRLPGVTFPGVNRSRDIKLRGLPKEYTQVLLDGRPLLDGDTSRNMEVDRIPASFIERIEITRTPLASMESQGAAGTVNIITRRNFGPSGGQLTMGAGHIEDNGVPGEISAWQGGTTGPLRYFIGGGYQRRLVQESSTEYVYKPDGSLKEAEIGPQHRKFDEYTLLSRFELAIDTANTIVLSPSYLRTTEQRDQNTIVLDSNGNFKQDTHEVRKRIRETYGANVEWQHDFDSVTASRVFFDYQAGREDTTRASTRKSGTGSYKPRDGRFVPADLERIAAGTAYTTRMGGHTVEAGFGWAERSHDEAGVTLKTNGTVVPEVDRTYEVKETIYHAYVSDRFRLLGNDLLTLGLRLEQSKTDTRSFEGDTTATDSTDFNPSLNYRLSAAENLDFRLGIARTLRRPDLSDLTPTIADGDGSLGDPYERGDPNMTPEKIWGLDIGTDYYFLNRTGIVAANFFARSITDKIETILTREYIPDDGADMYVQTFRNAGDGYLYGFELEGRLPLAFAGLTDVTLWGNATAMKSQLEDVATGQKRRFDKQPDLITNVGFDYYIRAWDATLGLGYNRTYAYDQDIEVSGGEHQLTSFSALDRLDASLRIALDEQVVLTLTASNLLRTTDERVLTEIDGGGVNSVTVSREPSPAVYYARLTQGW